MKIENEITGHVKIHTSSRLQIELWVKDEQVDFFTLDLVNKKVQNHLNSTKLLLDVSAYDDYIKLLDDLGLEVPLADKRHWTPKIGEGYFYINSEGEVCPNYIANFGYNEVDQKRYENYNMFPARELAEKAANLSKLDRLILLWQYANDCMFDPDWSSDDRAKYHVMYDNVDKKVSCDYNNNLQSDTVYFKTEEQARAFVIMYEKEIKEIMGVD